jgi:drug/metabolite transporter (DMT)-like permease
VSRLAIVAAAGTGVQVGAAMVATRFVVDQTDPASLAMLRYIIGFLCLVPPMLLAGQGMRFERKDVAPIALLGIIQFGVLVALLNYGLRFIPAARAALIFATFPLMTMVIAAALGRERLGLAKTAGVLLTILGVGVALGEKAVVRSGTDAAWIGEAAVLACTFCGALCSVLYRPYLHKYPTLPVSAFAILASVVFLAMLAFGEGFFTTPLRFTTAGWGAVLFIGFSSGVGYFMWLWALGHASPTRVSAFLALSPITAALLGALLLGEPLSPGALTGLALVVVGLWVAHLQPLAARTSP